jgi:hypothetical protein
MRLDHVSPNGIAGRLRTHNWVATMPPGHSIQVLLFFNSCYICVEVTRPGRLYQGGQMTGFDAPVVDFRIFGSPMNRGRTQMPAGILKSEGFASSLADPTGHNTLQQFCEQAARPYGRAPVTILLYDG